MPDRLRIVMFGDSITNGAGVKEPETFRHIVQNELTRKLALPVEAVNAGINGDIVTLATQRLEKDVLNRKPDLVTVMFGGNEAGFYRPETNGFAATPRVSRDAFKTALETVVDRLQAAKITVVLMTCPPMTDKYWGADLEPYQQNGINFLVKDYAQTMRDVAAEKQVELVDVYDAFQQDDRQADLLPRRPAPGRPRPSPHCRPARATPRKDHFISANISNTASVIFTEAWTSTLLVPSQVSYPPSSCCSGVGK